MRRPLPYRRLLPFLLLALALPGCATLGPGTISRDRLGYHEALSESWKSQTLLNLLRLRYADQPVFLDVASVVNSYSLETGGSVGTESGPHTSDFINLGVHGIYTDRPTITYSPVGGEKFTKSVLTPLTPVAILSLVQVGYPVDTIFRICVKSVNGISNQSGAYALRGPADPKFMPLLEALRRVQVSGGVGMRLEKRAGEESAVILLRKGRTPDLEADQRFVRETLGLTGDSEYRLVFGSHPSSEREVAILTRSMLEIMAEMGSGIAVPEKDIAEGRVVPPPTFGDGVPNLPSLLQVHFGTELPADAYSSARYRGQWFWIDDRDVPSKRAFNFLMILFSLAETGGHPNVPVLTIPAG